MNESSPEAARQAVYVDAFAVGQALRELGTHNCAPVLDLFHARANGIIGTRSYSPRVQVVAELGTACMRRALKRLANTFRAMAGRMPTHIWQFLMSRPHLTRFYGRRSRINPCSGPV